MIQEALAGGIQAVQESIAEHGSFADWARSLLASKAHAQFWVLIWFGLAGVAANYLWKWIRDEIRGSLWRYLVVSYPKRTIASFLAIGGWAFVTVSSGMVEQATAWSVVVNLGVTTGFCVDALVNKADRVSWTAQERAIRNLDRDGAFDPDATPVPRPGRGAAPAHLSSGRDGVRKGAGGPPPPGGDQ